MRYFQPQLFIVQSPRSWPLKPFDNSSPSVVNYGRKITNVRFSDDDAAELTFTESGETAELIGLPAIPGTIVLCVRVNISWAIIQTCFVATEKRVLENATDDDEPEASTYEDDVIVNGGEITVRPDEADHYPFMVELITTGDNKTELDGLYCLCSRFKGKQQRRDRVNYKRIPTSRANRPGGASMNLSFVGTYDSEEDEVIKTYTLTVTHSDITTTVYQGTENRLTKQSGDDTLPEDVWLSFNDMESMCPLWFEIDADSPLDGLYTLWPEYWEDSTNTSYATSKGYYHKPDGTRSTLDYRLEYNASSEVFTIDAGDFEYTCDLENFSFVNGEKMRFQLSVNDTGHSLPDSLIVKRPSTGYSRTVKEADQK